MARGFRWRWNIGHRPARRFQAGRRQSLCDPLVVGRASVVLRCWRCRTAGLDRLGKPLLVFRCCCAGVRCRRDQRVGQQRLCRLGLVRRVSGDLRRLQGRLDRGGFPCYLLAADRR